METVSVPKVECAVAARIRSGESVSGDRHVIKPFPGGVLMSVVDGLGHGRAAAESAAMAIETLQRHAGESVMSLMLRCHAGLRATRGVAVSLATVRSLDGEMAWFGVGNVEGVLLRATPGNGPRQLPLPLLPGIVGAHLPLLPQADRVPLKQGDTLVLVTDGIRSNFAESLATHGPAQRIADGILQRYARGVDDALVLVARYLEPGL